MRHDTWEDMYSCTICYLFYEPEELHTPQEHGELYLKGLSNVSKH
jgi:hypothetical protein